MGSLAFHSDVGSLARAARGYQAAALAHPRFAQQLQYVRVTFSMPIFDLGCCPWQKVDAVSPATIEAIRKA